MKIINYKMITEVAYLNNVTFWNHYANVSNITPYDDNQLPLFFDDNHLSRYGNDMLFGFYEHLETEGLQKYLLEVFNDNFVVDK